MRAWHARCFGEKLIMAELGKLINVFHNVSTAFNTVTKVHYKARFLQKAINFFHSVNLTLFTVTSKKGKKRETWKQDGIWQNLRVKRSLFQLSYTRFSIFLHSIYIYQKLYIHHWRPVCFFSDTNRRFKFGIWLYAWVGMITWQDPSAGLITWYGWRITRLTFSESRSFENVLRKEYIQQKETEAIYMGLFTFIPGAQFLDLCWERNRFGK